MTHSDFVSFHTNDNKFPQGEFPCAALPLDGLCCKRGGKKLTLFSSGFPLSGINSAQPSLRREISRDYLILSGIHAMLMKLVLLLDRRVLQSTQSR